MAPAAGKQIARLRLGRLRGSGMVNDACPLPAPSFSAVAQERHR